MSDSDAEYHKACAQANLHLAEGATKQGDSSTAEQALKDTRSHARNWIIESENDPGKKLEMQRQEWASEHPGEPWPSKLRQDDPLLHFTPKDPYLKRKALESQGR
jgi:hypothetical protein